MRFLHSRPKTIAFLASAPLLLTLSAGLPLASADPEAIDDQAKTVAQLYHEAEAASEAYNELQVEAEALRDELESLQADEARQVQAMETARAQVRDMVVDQYTSQSLLSNSTRFLTADDPSEFMSDLATQASANDIMESKYSTYAVELDALELREEAVAAALEDLEALEARAQLEQDKLHTAHDEAVARLRELKREAEAEELAAALAAAEAQDLEATREAPVSRAGGPRAVEPSVEAEAPALPPNASRVERVLAFARAQLGDAYVYGAAGPDAWDCSGLTMAAWAEGGVALPHSSRIQATMGTAVPFDQLQPGDLLFYYSPISHVGIYAGDGMVLHAANPASGVEMLPVHTMPLTAARRVG